MPRRGANSKSNDLKKGPPPNHPQENYPEHRMFLIRSLERNDVDMAALAELNTTLKQAKHKIVQTCGELVLLDLGCGRLTLVNDELHEVTGEVVDETTKHHLTPAQKEACVDFLLRMKLRKKLCNRIVRRLTRIATAMDGNNVAPPAPPKYGDLRLHVDDDKVEARVEEWKQKEEAKKRIEAALRGDESVYAVEETAEEAAGEDGDKKPEEEACEKEKEDTKSPDDAAAKDADDGPKPMDIDSSTDAAKDGAEKAAEKPDETKDDEADKAIKAAPPTLESDYELLRDYDDAYQQVWDSETRTFQYFIPAEEKDAEPEYTEIKNGAGIGAMNKGMTLPDREAEYKRWQAAVLAKIPDQPTFEELGLKNRVFCLEERRKRCLEEAEGSDNEESPSKKAKTESDDAQDETKDDAETKENEKSTEDGESKSEKEEKKKITFDDLKPKRPISFSATPSFHEQDLARIRLIHRDMVGYLKSERGREALAFSTNEYNNALRQSVQLVQSQHQLQSNLTFVIAKGREELSQANHAYGIQFNQAKHLWMSEKSAHDAKRLQAVIPSKSGKTAEGTPLIAAFVQSNVNNDVQAAVGKCLADVVDGAMFVAEGKSPIPKFRDFVPPARPIVNEQGEDAVQRQRRVETEYRNQYNHMTPRLQKSEEKRAMAWRKMMKAKADLELYHQAIVNGQRQNILVHQNNHQNFPLPPLRGSVTATMPRELTRQSVQVASYRPPAVASSSTGTNKYSADKIRQRKAADGTVAPVSELKKTEDGLYMRPAGRTRKGMRWDAITGVWVPLNQS